MQDDHQTSPQDPERRDFVKRSGAAVAGASVMSAAALLAPASEAWAQSLAALNPADGRTLVRMCRDIYPHDTLPDAIYERVVSLLDAEAARDSGVDALLTGGVKELDTLSRRMHGREYRLVASEGDRVSVLQRMEETAFFQKVRGSLVTGLYNNPETWKTFGYEGASAHLGGYLKRGFDDLDWL